MKWFKKYLIIFGASCVGVVVFAFLHNLFQVLDMISPGYVILDQISFFLAIIVCPLGIVVGAVGIIVLGIRKLRRKNKVASS